MLASRTWQSPLESLEDPVNITTHKRPTLIPHLANGCSSPPIYVCIASEMIQYWPIEIMKSPHNSFSPPDCVLPALRQPMARVLRRISWGCSTSRGSATWASGTTTLHTSGRCGTSVCQWRGHWRPGRRRTSGWSLEDPWMVGGDQDLWCVYDMLWSSWSMLWSWIINRHLCANICKHLKHLEEFEVFSNI